MVDHVPPQERRLGDFRDGGRVVVVLGSGGSVSGTVGGVGGAESQACAAPVPNGLWLRCRNARSPQHVVRKKVMVPEHRGYQILSAVKM